MRWTLLLMCTVSALAGCGRRESAPAEQGADLRVTAYRYNIDEEHKVARIMAQITNFGTTPVKSVPVKAILRGPDGTARGQNTITVHDIRPGATRLFSMEITTHGRERDVDFRIGPDALKDEQDTTEPIPR